MIKKLLTQWLTFFFAFEVLTQDQEIKSISSSNYLNGCTFIFSLSSYEREVDQ